MNEHYLIVSGMFFKKRKRIVKTKKLAKKRKKFDFVLSILKLCKKKKHNCKYVVHDRKTDEKKTLLLFGFWVFSHVETL